MSASLPARRRRLSPLLLYLAFVAGWVFASVLVVRTVLAREHTSTELTVSWFFVTATGVLIAALIDRDYRSRQESARLLEETQRVIDSVAVVTDPSLAELGFGELLPDLLVRIRDVLGADSASVLLLEGDPPELVLAAAPGADELVGRRVPAGTGVCWRAATSGAVEVVSDVRTVADAVPGVETASRSLVAAPLVVDGNLIGVMEVGGIEPRDFGVYDLQLVHLVADRAAAAIDRGRLDEIARSLYDAVSSNEARLQAVYDASPFSIVELDLAGHPVLWNRAAVELFDWPARDGVVELPLEPAPLAEKLVRDALGGGEVLNVELNLAGSDPLVQVEVASAALRDGNGAVRGALLIGIDTSERRRVAEQLQQAQRMEAMGRLAGGVAHDFNNLLMVIGGYAGLLLQRVADDPDQVKEVEAIARAAERAAAITGQLLTISRHQVVAPEVVAIDALLDEMRSVLQLAAGNNVGVVVEHHAGTDEGPRTTLIDPAQIEQVLLNLAINARDAMPTGGTLVVGEARRDDADGQWVVLTVADDGEGMDARQVEHCFDPFFTTKPKTKGTGLGLSTAYGVVTQAGGTIRVESRRGEGTTFTIELPAADTSELVEPGDRDLSTAGPVGSGRILLVEDEPDVRALTGDLLELEGYEVTAVPDAERALEVAEAAAPDLLLTDVVMPGMNGIDLAAELSRRLPDLRVLFVSGYAEDAPERRGQVVDAAYLLSKPAPASVLVSRVQRAIDGRPWREIHRAR